MIEKCQEQSFLRFRDIKKKERKEKRTTKGTKEKDGEKNLRCLELTALRRRLHVDVVQIHVDNHLKRKDRTSRQ